VVLQAQVQPHLLQTFPALREEQEASLLLFVVHLLHPGVMVGASLIHYQLLGFVVVVVALVLLLVTVEALVLGWKPPALLRCLGAGRWLVGLVGLL
tara:strand:+ start:2462 stop:2749 length:288 start_codon:yes stop_codon:yes gene_type:complete